MHSEPAGIFYPRSSTGNGHEHSKYTFLHVKMHLVGNVMTILAEAVHGQYSVCVCWHINAIIIQGRSQDFLKGGS